MEFKRRTLTQLADMICGNFAADSTHFVYRSSSYLTEFFEDCETDYAHDGSTRKYWVADSLKKILDEPSPAPNLPSEAFARVIARLMDRSDAINESADRSGALAELNLSLAREGFEAFYADDGICYLRHVATGLVASNAPNPHRPFSVEELRRREMLAKYLDQCNEDELIENVLLPLFRQLGFQRITSAGHKDKALEYGKDIWMKYVLPTRHVIYFGIQAKRDKIDSSGVSKSGSLNVGELLNQVTMMLGHEVFDPELNRRALIDHAFIVSGGEITKAARNWLGGKLDASKRSQVMFMERDDLLNLFAVTSLPVPQTSFEDDIPF